MSNQNLKTPSNLPKKPSIPFQTLFLSLLILFLQSQSVDSKILFVFSCFRHGHRGPGFGNQDMQGFHTDLYGIKWEGNGELTNIGLRSEYLLGTISRKKYNDLLSNLYDPKEIMVLSSPKRRAIMSAQAQLQGLYPPVKYKKINSIDNIEISKANPPIKIEPFLSQEISNLKNSVIPQDIQIIPVYLLDSYENNMLLTDKSVCPNAEKYKDHLRNSSLFNNFCVKLNKTYGKELLNFFNATNDPNYLFNLRNVFSIFDVFLADYENKKDLSDFVNKTGIDLESFYNMSLEFKTMYLFNYETDEYLSNLAMSITIPKIIEWMDKRIEHDIKKSISLENYGNFKYVMYSAHDKTLSPFQLFLKPLFNIPVYYPKFASNIFIELHKNDSLEYPPYSYQDYYVIYYFNGEPLFTVDYKTFRRKVLGSIWNNEKINKFCGIENPRKLVDDHFYIVLIVVLFTLFCFVLVLKKYIIKLCRDKWASYKKKTRRDRMKKFNYSCDDLEHEFRFNKKEGDKYKNDGTISVTDGEQLGQQLIYYTSGKSSDDKNERLNINSDSD